MIKRDVLKSIFYTTVKTMDNFIFFKGDILFSNSSKKELVVDFAKTTKKIDIEFDYQITITGYHIIDNNQLVVHFIMGSESCSHVIFLNEL